MGNNKDYILFSSLLLCFAYVLSNGNILKGVKNMQEWEEVDLYILGKDLSLHDVLVILDDALTHGSIFKVENHKLYMKEIDC